MVPAISGSDPMKFIEMEQRVLLLLNYDINLPTREFFALRLLALCNASPKEIFLTSYFIELSLLVSAKYYLYNPPNFA